MADGKVVISTALDNSGIEKDGKKMNASVRSQAMKLAHEYKKQGMSLSDAMKKAYTELGYSGKKISKEVGDSLKWHIGGGADSVSTKLSSMLLPIKGALGGLTKVVAKTAAAVTAAFAVAAVAITKQAVSAYADYEQLTGGVETLFKDSADKVKAYAEDAFFTVGISANEYMSTVTSFSASLISSLGGDTEKAADVANMALVDMADNANKMGSSMESIQNAYQGFAKQNYTMLDNLKLGYGGTKTEMERLLTDAQKLTGVKYNISNLSDVYMAIHAIQENLGIAGTTAQEAEGTISGSAAMMKAAWQNTLSAIAGGGDLDKAVNNLVYSVSKYFENIVPIVQRALVGIGQMVEKVAPMLVQTVASALIRAIPSLLNAVYQMILGLVKGIYQGIIDLFSGKTTGQISKVTSSAGKSLDTVTEGYKGAETAAKDAKKAADRYLAGFDEIQKLGDNKTADVGDISMGSIGDVSAGTITVDGEVSDEASTKIEGVFSSIIGKIQEWLQPLREIDFSNLIVAFENLKNAAEPLVSKLFEGLEWLYLNVLVPLAAWTIEDLLPAFLDILSGAFDVLNAILEALQPLAQWLWDSFLRPIAEWTGGMIVEVLGWIADGLVAISDWITNHQSLVEAFVIIVGSVAAAFLLVNTAMKVWNGIMLVWNNLGAISTAVTTAFGAAVNFLTSPITLVTLAIGALIAIVVLLVRNWDTVKEVAANVWEGIKSVWNAVADWFKVHVTEPVANFFKGMVNGIIGFINGMMSALASGINLVIKALNKLSFDVPDWVPGIGGSTWGFNIAEITAKKIPYLAQGAVLPANKPFLAMVGDQKHGTNVEAPLTTIQEAVAIVMEDMVQSNVAGFEATIAVLREILEAVLGIEIGDDVIGRAAARYNNRLAIRNGGVRT